MKTPVLAALIASVPLGAIVGLMFKLDARARKRPSRPGLQLMAVGSVACFVGMSALVFVLGGFGPESKSAPEPMLSAATAPAPVFASASAASASAVASPPALGSATLTWTAPETHADGSALRDLAGYRIYYGAASDNYSASITVSDPTATTHTIQNLPAGTYYFVVKAYDKGNAESTRSPEVNKTIR